MEQIYSKVQPDKILHTIHRLQDVINRKEQRLDLIDEDQFIQCSSLKMKKGTTFKAHRHIWKSGKKNSIAQESWCVIIGSVKGFFYDLDNTLLHTTNLYVGDVSFTLEGGHNYEILENDTVVYEYKTGPYEGQTLDKVFI
jgi:hypothetical protein|tara:strand:- start:1296 stop:1715 length:420 start_codon:yes stop_codon:yes gene_type:complete